MKILSVGWQSDSLAPLCWQLASAPPSMPFSALPLAPTAAYVSRSATSGCQSHLESATYAPPVALIFSMPMQPSAPAAAPPVATVG